jgi:uncharacterized protein (DUF2249 family)
MTYSFLTTERCKIIFSIFDILFSRGNERQIIEDNYPIKVDWQPVQPTDVQVMDDMQC